MHFHILSFEGPDGYARAGGIASRIVGLSETLAAGGCDTHLWFVGDPSMPGHETQGALHHHRWCQWISRYHPAGVYDGEDGKCSDYASSLPPYLMREHLVPALHAQERVTVLAEEWHTVDAVLHLDWLLKRAGLRSRVTILWNANNTFGFDRIDWRRLDDAALITTVSRYMKHLMQPLGVDPIVIPNGLSSDVFVQPEKEAVSAFTQGLAERVVLTKMARFDPDKRWLLAIDIVARMKRAGLKPLLIARGGAEAHGLEVLERARAHGLSIIDREARKGDAMGVIEMSRSANHADVINIKTPVNAEGRRVLFRGSDVVLANSSHEPFGLVGLEAMAVGGLACTGISGEDYAVPGHNALVMQTSDPDEFVGAFQQLQAEKNKERSMRRAGMSTAKQYAWTEVLARSFMPRLSLCRPENQ